MELKPPPTWIYSGASGATAQLRLLDQRKLPNEIVYLTCQTGAEVAGAIQEMVVRGAPLIGIVAAFGVALEMQRLKTAPSSASFTQTTIDAFHQVAKTLCAARPTAVNLAWAVGRMQRVFAAGGDLLKEAESIAAEDLAMNKSLGLHGAALLPKRGNILTHCNAGYLATGGWGTALGVIRSAMSQGKELHIWVDETRPYLQGSRLTAWELMQDHIPCTLIADNMAASLMAKGKIDAVMVGADRIAMNGDVANKIGTYGLAVLAQAHDIPFYVAAPSSTIDPECVSGETMVIEERASQELTQFAGSAIAPQGVKVFNPSFDVTPAKYIAAIITEHGAARPPYATGLAKVVREVLG